MSEARIIARYFAPLAAGHAGALGLRDDAAVVVPPPGHDLVATMDAVAAGVHFLPDDSAADVGWKALAVNVSDLVAKGATPHAYLMSVAFPDMPDDAWLADFARGLGEAQAAFGGTLVGGDTDRRPGPVAITVTALGFVPTGRMVRRGTARVGDRVVVTGDLGASAIGLALRLGTARARAWPTTPADRHGLETRYLRPRPTPAVAPALRHYASAAMDVSDGLLKDARRMADLCGVRIEIAAADVPVCSAVAIVRAADPTALGDVLTGGDDYCVLATVAPADLAAFTADAAAVGVPVTSIGTVVAGCGVGVTGADGREIDPGRSGYDHF